MSHKIDVDSGNPYRDELGRFDSEEGTDSKKIEDSEHDDFDLDLGELTGIDVDDDLKEFGDMSTLFDDATLDDDLKDVDKFVSPLTSEQENLINELGYGDVELSLINEFDDLDKEMIMNASEEELKALLKAKLLLKNADLIIQNDKELKKLNEEDFSGLWLDTKKAKDYEKLIGEKTKDSDLSKFEAKYNFFNETYSGLDKEEKINLLNKLKESGEKYISRKDEITESYKKLEDFVSIYKDTSSPYSNIRKEKAKWIVGSGAEAIKTFGTRADAVLSKLKEKDPDAYESVRFYTGSFSVINEPLRGTHYGKSDPSPFGFKKTVEALTRAVDNSTYDFDFWVERGTDSLRLSNGKLLDSWISDDDLNDLIGQEFKQQGFYSSSALKGSSLAKNVVLYTYCPRGTKGLFVESISKHPGQYEMIIQRGYSYKIIGAKKESDILKLDVQVVLGSDNEKYDSDELTRIEREYVD